MNQRQLPFCHHLLLFTIFLVVNTSSFAQNTSYIANVQHFSTKDGLSHRAVKSVFQDQDGIMWIGTQNGLNRFDGYSFKHYLGKNYGVDLRDNVRIGQDDEGWLWLCTIDHRITFFNPKTEQAKTIEERFGANCILLNNRNYLLTSINDNKGRLYIQVSQSNELYTYHSSEGFKKITTPFYFKDAALKEITDKGEFIIFDLIEETQGTKGFFAKWEIKGNTLHSLNQTENWNNIGFQWTEKDFKTNLTWKINKEGFCQVFDKNGQLLVSLEDYSITNFQSIFFDNQNRAWISTGFGFYVVEVQKNKFQFLAAPIFPNFGTSARGISVDDNKMTVAFEREGIGQYDFQTSKWSALGNMVWNRAIYQTDKNAFWIGSADDLSHWQENQFQHYPHKPIKDAFGRPHGLAPWVICPSQQNKHHLWLGGESYLIRFDTKTKAYQHFEHPNFNTKNLIVQSITYDKNNKNWLWLCTHQGLFLFDEQKEEFITYYNDNQSDKRFLPSEGFYHLYQKDDVYWLGTIGNGLVRWEREKGTFQQFTIKDGLANDNIYAIYPDDFGNFWMSSDYGITQMNKETFAIKNFLKKDGIEQIEFNRTSHVEYRNEKEEQRLFFGGLEGVTTFYPKDFQETNQQIRPFLTVLNYQHFSSKQQDVVDKTLELYQHSKIILYPNDYVHAFEVGLLNYNEVEANQYFYQLNKGDWKNQKSRLIQLGQLPYGTHQLKIKAKTISNVEAANELVFTIVVRRPFYLTWWFIILASISVVGSGFYIYKRRTKQLKARQIELEQLVKERTEKIEEDKAVIEKQAKELQKLDTLKSRFFANVSHELRTPLTLILGPINTTLKRGDLTNRDFTMLSKAKQSGKNLLKLVGSILDLSKMEANKMDLMETPIVVFPFIRRIISAFESHAEREGIQFSFEYNADENLQLELDKEKLEIILNNLLSNAIKFTSKGGKVEINIEDKKNKIQLTVADTGRGIHKDDLPNVFDRFYQSEHKSAKIEGGTGIGLALSREFIELMNGKIWVESEWMIGSQFHVVLPRKEILRMVQTSSVEEEQPIRNIINTIPIPLTQSNKTILIVEDNYSLRDYIQTIIEPHHHTIIAENGQVAFDLLSQNQTDHKKQPDLILSDIMMPEMDGYQLLEHLKSTDYFRNIPVIMLTARADIQDKLKALRIGVDDYLLKPFDEEELLTRIENLLANYEERKAFVQTENTEETNISNEPTISEEDQKWLENVENLILKEMNNSIFSVDYIAELLFISPRTLYRKIKSLTGLTPSKYIRTIRLQQAKILLEKGKSVKKTAYEVGFQKVDYFSKLFKKEFGKSPSEYN